MKILVYAYRDWSLANIEPALDGYEWTRWHENMDWKPNWKEYHVIITCEPTINGWKNAHPGIKEKFPVLCMQQAFRFSPTCNHHATWRFTKIMAWGEQARTGYRISKLSNQRITVTGNPKHQTYRKSKKEDHDYVLVCGSKNHGDVNEFMPVMRKLAEEIKVIYKPHPTEIVDAKQQHGIEYVSDVADTHELMKNCSGVLVSVSACGLDAMVMKKPVVVLESSYPLYYGTSSYTPKEDAAERMLKEIKSPSNHDQFVDWCSPEVDAIKNVRQQIEDFAI